MKYFFECDSHGSRIFCCKYVQIIGEYQKINYLKYTSTLVGAHCVRPECGDILKLGNPFTYPALEFIPRLIA
jgi:hypothetical protein